MCAIADMEPPEQVSLAAPLLGTASGAAPGGVTGYLHPVGSQDFVKAATHWVVTDLNTEAR